MQANRFRILLNWISARLNEQEIRSLVLICNVPEGQRARMEDGISLFDNLIKRDIINEHKLDKLKMMLKNLCPRRRDLIREIEEFENGGIQTQADDDKSSTLTSVLSMPRSMPSTIKPGIREPCCIINWPCIAMSCYNVSWSYALLTAIFIIFFIIPITLFWYADVPKVSEAIASEKHVKEAGPFILIAIVVVYVACLLIMCCVKKRRRNRRSNQSATTTQNRNQMLETVNEEPGTTSAENIGISTFRENRPSTSSIEVNSTGTSNVRETGTASVSNFGFSRDMDDSSNADPDTAMQT